MRRWEQEAHDAALDGSRVKGQPCPVCGGCELGGDGPCSEACERIERRREIRDEIADEQRAEAHADWVEGFR